MTARLSAVFQRTEILGAAKRILCRNGLDGFSLQKVARAAKVAGALPKRHFGGKKQLLQAVTEDVLKEVKTILLAREFKDGLAPRLHAYLDVVASNPWAHALWTRVNGDPGLDQAIRRARVRFAEAMFGLPWVRLSTAQRAEAQTRISQVDEIVGAWLIDGRLSRETVVASLLAVLTVRKDDVVDGPRAAVTHRGRD